MKIYNRQKTTLTPELENLLQQFRLNRNFNVDQYIQAKTLVINEYFTAHQIHTAVVGVSGGIDSAVVLSLLTEAAKAPGSYLKEIIPVLLPLSKSQGATNQVAATLRGQELCTSLNLKANTIDLSLVEDALRAEVEPSTKIKGQPWAIGQLVAYLRTPSLYYITALWAQDGHRAVVCGTTNQDEGAYIGYFGKASDGLVDVQIISDLHKSEVYQVAERLQVPRSILTIAPSGDMYDGRVDEEVFGASYAFLELYMHYLRLNDLLQKSLLEKLDAKSLSQFNQGKTNLDKMHKYNSHKYLGASPAIHLDVLIGNVPKGWKNNKTIEPIAPSSLKIVNPILLPKDLVDKMYDNQTKVSVKVKDSVYNLSGILVPKECEELVNFLQSQTWVPTGKDGYTKTFNEDQTPGSYRISSFSQSLADLLWYRLQQFLPATRIMTEADKTDFHPHSVWTPMGISPVFRFIKYEKGGELIPHFDAPYVYHDGKKTLMSLVIYLTTNKTGATRIIKDNQDTLPFSERSFQDWLRPAKTEEIISSIKPTSGCGIMFDHRILHDGEEVSEETKIILRTDIIFTKGGA
jgi:NAD+ synthetase